MGLSLGYTSIKTNRGLPYKTVRTSNRVVPGFGKQLRPQKAPINGLSHPGVVGTLMLFLFNCAPAPSSAQDHHMPQRAVPWEKPMACLIRKRLIHTDLSSQQLQDVLVNLLEYMADRPSLFPDGVSGEAIDEEIQYLESSQAPTPPTNAPYVLSKVVDGLKFIRDHFHVLDTNEDGVLFLNDVDGLIKKTKPCYPWWTRFIPRGVLTHHARKNLARIVGFKESEAAS